MQVLPEAARRGIAVLGMKSLGGSGEMVRHGSITAPQGLRYAMSLPVATTICGVDSMEVLDQNLAVATNFQPLPATELKELRDQCRQFAADGRFELFKMTTKYDGKVGREQHHFPSAEELPLKSSRNQTSGLTMRTSNENIRGSWARFQLWARWET